MIPNYLLSIATEVSSNKEKTCLHISCSCGCDNFSVYKRKKDAFYIKQEKEYKKKILREYGCGYEMISDKNGNVFIQKRNLFGLVTKKERYNQLDIPVFMNFVSVKCNKCEKKYVLFDQKLHGYDKYTNITTLDVDNVIYTSSNEKIDVDLYYNLENKQFEQDDSTIRFGRIVIFSSGGSAKKKIIDVECE